MRNVLATACRIGFLSCLLTTVLSAQQPEIKPGPTAEQEASKKRLDYMFDSCAGYTGRRNSDGALIKVFPKPLLRWTNPNFGVRDGLFVVWVDENNRPMAAGQVFLFPRSENRWYIEQQSLCDGAMSFTSETNTAWDPTKPGVEWKRFTTKRLEPAKSSTVRLAQMRQLARRFRGEDDLVDEDDELRLLPDPMVRYDDTDNGILDGTLFALVQGTDPELLVLIEARADSSGRKAYWWAVAPMTSASADAFLDDVRVYSKESDGGSRTSLFYMRQLSGGVAYPKDTK